MSDLPASNSEQDARIALLEFQAEFLRRETEFVTKRYKDIVHSAAWTIAKPIKRVEDFLHRLVGQRRQATLRKDDVARRNLPRDVQQDLPLDLPLIPIGASDDEITKIIAARIAARVARPSLLR